MIIIKTAPLLFLMVIGGFSARAQSIKPEKNSIELNGSSRPCIVVHLDPGAKSLKKAWVKFLRKEYDFKLKGAGCFSNRDLLTVKQVVVEKISTKRMDFYTQVIMGAEYTKMSVFISFGYDVFVNEEEYPVEFEAMNEMLESF